MPDRSSSDAARPPGDRQAHIRQRILRRFKQGDLARAYDLCTDALRGAPDDLWLRHRAVLCLIRSGALERAEEAYRRYRLAEALYDEDCLSLGARLLKARALEAQPEDFVELAGRAARKYADVFEQTRGHYPAINAATMHLLAGEKTASEQYARAVLSSEFAAEPAGGEEAYYQMASRAEAHLLLGDLGGAHGALRAAIARDPENLIAHATTIQQFRLVLAARGRTAGWLSELEPPRPCHFAGHMFRRGDAGIGAAEEARLVEQIEAAIQGQRVGSVFGAMAAGADVLIAETALRSGHELHAVLPLPVGPFIDASVRPLGQDWVRRCEQCLGEATSIHELATDRRDLSPMHLRFASDVAMGLARIRAGVLATEPAQILVWDGAEQATGTAGDARRWAAAGLAQHVIPFETRHRYRPDSPLAARPGHSEFSSVLRAMIFVDVRGSTTIADDDVPAFVEDVLGGLARRVAGLDPAPVYSDSWGDGIFLAFETVTAAARAATELLNEFSGIDLQALGLPQTLALRIGGHFGPVHEGQDRFQKRPSLFGGQVALASRIEGVAVPGSIFVSAPFAALLAMSEGHQFRCEYMGPRQVDPLLPEVPLFSLREVAPGSVAAGDWVRSDCSAQPA